MCCITALVSLHISGNIFSPQKYQPKYRSAETLEQQYITDQRRKLKQKKVHKMFKAKLIQFKNISIRVTLFITIKLYANNVVCCFPAALSPQTDPAVISPRAPSSPSPRAHKSSRSAVTPARPRGPGWHSVFHYKLVSLAERHNPNTLTAFLWSAP